MSHNFKHDADTEIALWDAYENGCVDLPYGMGIDFKVEQVSFTCCEVEQNDGRLYIFADTPVYCCYMAMGKCSVCGKVGNGPRMKVDADYRLSANIGGAEHEGVVRIESPNNE